MSGLRRLLAPLAAGTVWLALWGEVSWANVLSGVVVVASTFALVPPASPAHRLHPVGLARFAVDFLRRLWSSSVTVAVACLAPTPERLRAGVVEFRLRSESSLVATVVANSISLTPGTLTLDVFADPPRLLVHVMGLGDPEEVLDDLRLLEQMVLAAIEPLGSVAGITPSGRPADTESGR